MADLYESARKRAREELFYYTELRAWVMPIRPCGCLFTIGTAEQVPALDGWSQLHLPFDEHLFALDKIKTVKQLTLHSLLQTLSEDEHRTSNST